MFKTIIAAVDGSKAADKALEVAAKLSAKFEAELHILNVPQDDTAALVSVGYGGYAAVSGLQSKSHYKEIGARIVSKAADNAKEIGAQNVATHVLPGVPSTNILKLSTDTNADLIVSGRRGLGGVKGMLVGSTSQKVSKSAECAILTTH